MSTLIFLLLLIFSFIFSLVADPMDTPGYFIEDGQLCHAVEGPPELGTSLACEALP